MDFNEIIPRLWADGRLTHMEKVAFVALALAGGASGHVQNRTLGEIGEHANPKVSAAALSDAIGTLQRTGWISGEKPSAKESWDIRINSPSRNVKTTVLRSGHTIITTTAEELED